MYEMAVHLTSVRKQNDYIHCTLEKLLKPTWWCGALPGVTMAVLYLAHIHEQHGCGHGICAAGCHRCGCNAVVCCVV